jgi:1,2-diacylglycerol 3-alpha-glucosyltransferase
MSNKKPNVFIVCTGVGHINRGYESFTKEFFTALEHNDQFNLFMLKGAGETKGNEIKINCAIRNSKTAATLSRITGKEGYWVEQATFLFSMLPYIIRYKPVVIYYSDFILGTFLWHLQSYFKFKYKLLFSNGAPNGPPFSTMHHVQQLLPVYLESATKAGADPDKQTLLPYGFDIDIKERLESIKRKNEIREQLGIKKDQKIILSVGAINKSFKRMDYTINEAANLPEDYFLIILGQVEDETPELLELAAQKLPGRHIITNVPSEKVKDYYIAADYFVLSSLNEGFGRVLIEALSYGLPCFVNDYINAKQVLGEYGIYTDMKQPGALTKTILNQTADLDREMIIKSLYETYSWDKLKSKYADMIIKVSNQAN